jgi:hypothetical protein
MAYPMAISQQAGNLRALTLQGASLPEKGTWSIPGEQRTNIEWMAGSRVAVSQVLGAIEEAMPMAGSWLDTLVGNDGHFGVLVNFPRLSPMAEPGTELRRGITGGPIFLGTTPVFTQEARTAIALWGAMDVLRTEGTICKLEWGPIVRYGFVGLFTPTPDMITDVNWEMEFRVTGLSLSQPRPVIKTITLPGLLKSLLAAIQAILDKILALKGKIDAWIMKVEAGLDRIVSLILALADLLRQALDLLSTPFDLLQRIRASLQAVVTAAKDVAFTASQFPDAVTDSLQAVGIAVAASGDTAAGADAVLDAMELRNLIITAGVAAAQRSADIEKLTASQLLGVVVAPSLTTLQSLSKRFYGDPSRWQALLEFNGLTSSVVPSGTVVSIPRL